MNEKPTPPYKVLIVDDSAVVRKTLREIYSSDPELEVAGTAPDALIALRMLGEKKIDVISLVPSHGNLEVFVSLFLATLAQRVYYLL